MKNIKYLILLLVLFFAFITNPGLETHRGVIFNEITRDNPPENRLESALKTLIGEPSLQEDLDRCLQHTNLVLFSLTHYDCDGDRILTSIGLFGKVITVDGIAKIVE